MNKPAELDASLNIRINRELKRRLRIEAAHRDKAPSELLRELVERGVETLQLERKAA